MPDLQGCCAAAGDSIPSALAVAITTEKLALFSLGTFLAYQGHLAGPSASLSLSHLVFPLVPIS